MNKLIHL